MQACVHPKVFVLFSKSDRCHERLFNSVCVCDLSRFLLWERVCSDLYE